MFTITTEILTLNIFEVIAGLGFFAILLSIAFAVLWIWALIHALTHEFPTVEEKVIWLAVIILLPVIGLILYYFIGRKHTLHRSGL